MHKFVLTGFRLGYTTVGKRIIAIKRKYAFLANRHSNKNSDSESTEMVFFLDFSFFFLLLHNSIFVLLEAIAYENKCSFCVVCECMYDEDDA